VTPREEAQIGPVESLIGRLACDKELRRRFGGRINTMAMAFALRSGRTPLRERQPAIKTLRMEERDEAQSIDPVAG
jgi:hypothetical protein